MAYVYIVVIFISKIFTLSATTIQPTTSLCSATTYADNMALPAFARRTPRCCASRSNRSIYPAGRAHSSKPTAAGFLPWAHAGTDRQIDRRTDGRMDRRTDGRTPDRCIDPARSSMRVVPVMLYRHSFYMSRQP